MHNIGKTVHEMYENENEYGYEFEDEFESQYEGMNETMLNEMMGENYESSYEGEFEEEYEDEALEMELAAEFLEIQSEEELEEFIKKLTKRGGNDGDINPAVRNAARSKLGGILKKVAKVALPMAARVAGGMFGGPVGANLAGKAASFAGKMFGLELEGLSAEDREFETAKSFVKLGKSASNRTNQNLRRRMPPRTAVRKAVFSASRIFAPGLLLPARTVNNIYTEPVENNYEPYPDDNQDYIEGDENDQEYYIQARTTNRPSGRWIRRGNTIVLQGI